MFAILLTSFPDVFAQEMEEYVEVNRSLDSASDYFRLETPGGFPKTAASDADLH